MHGMVRSEELQRLRQERQMLRHAYQGLFDEISALLFLHDPIGINFDDNTDEYEPEVGTILPRLRQSSTVDELTRIVHEEFVRWFGRDVAGPIGKYIEIAREMEVLVGRYRLGAFR